LPNQRALLSLRELQRAFERLEEAAREPRTNPLALDGTIQRFEFVFELFWKTLRHVLADEGVESATPRATLRNAFAAGLIVNEGAWLRLLEARNETSHTYHEEQAKAVYRTIKRSLPMVRRALVELTKRVEGLG
jgi:nucleotidyltransferase substrate binding protein (TIGR01987 family)